MPRKTNRIKRLYFDIETSPCLAWAWSTGKQYVNADQILEPTKIICISYKWEGKKKVHSLTWDKNQCDKKMLKEFSAIMEEADEVVGHNGKSFDLRHINARVAYHGLKKVSVVFIEDTLKLARSELRLPSCSLNYLAKYFGIGEKVKTGGIDLWLDVWLSNDKKALKRMVTYCNGDVTLLENVYKRIKPYVNVRGNLAAVNEANRMCPSCGGKLHKHDKRFVTALRKVQRYRCQGCSKVFKGGINLLKKPSQYPR